MTVPYVLSPLAQRDIEGIWDYTEQRWGVMQAETYSRQLQSDIEAVAADPSRGRSCAGIRPGYSKYLSGSHVLFYRLAEGDVIEVVRILHKRMDVDRHLL